MRVGVPREIKQGEGRVALTPETTRALIDHGHTVVVESGAGIAAGFSDQEYEAAGARLDTKEHAWKTDLVIKVKEPTAAEYGFLSGQILMTYLHLAGADPELTETLLRTGTTGIAYETVTDADGSLPLLVPMSAVAGSMAPIVGNYHLAAPSGGRGTLLSEIVGESWGKVVVVGDGVVGTHAARVAGAMGAHVVVLGRKPDRQHALESMAPRISFMLSTDQSVAEQVVDTDLLVGAVLVQGARAPAVVSESMVAAMPKGSVIVDVSIDQGGCVATSRPTTHADPVFESHGVVHYCVTNMPGAYPRTSTQALTSATSSRVVELADQGFEHWVEDRGHANGVNTYRGFITHKAVARSLSREDRYRPLADCLT